MNRNTLLSGAAVFLLTLSSLSLASGERREGGVTSAGNDHLKVRYSCVYQYEEELIRTGLLPSELGVTLSSYCQKVINHSDLDCIQEAMNQALSAESAIRGCITNI